jgi:predicted HD superfamily hydrolase involved in NAD metabolism
MLCEKHGIHVSDEDLECPKVFHSLTGAYESKLIYPDYVDDEIFDAIKYHTTGRENMTLFDKLIYLADYIEDTRDFPDCIRLREYFYGKPATLRHLNETLLLSFDMTVRNLIDENFPIHPTTLKARNAIIKELK